MASSKRPSRSIDLAVGLFGACGVGVSLAVPQLVALGTTICFASAAVTGFLYFRQLILIPLWMFRRRVAMEHVSQETWGAAWLALAVICVGLGVPIYSYVTPQVKTEIKPKVFDAQFAELQELIQFIGGKDETILRGLFDFDSLLEGNVNIVQQKINFIRAGNFRGFHLFAYAGIEGGQLLVTSKVGGWSRTPGGFHVDAGPHDIYAIVLSRKYQKSLATLIRIENSTLIPETVLTPLKEFRKTVNDNSELLIEVLDESLKDNEENFVQYRYLNSKYFGAIRGSYFSKFTLLKPKADAVANAIRTYLGTQ